jgi:hypothetical protein
LAINLICKSDRVCVRHARFHRARPGENGAGTGYVRKNSDPDLIVREPGLREGLVSAKGEHNQCCRQQTPLMACDHETFSFELL